MITSYNDRSELISERQKSGEDYLTNQIDTIIAELVYEKDHLKKAYNYYNGHRDEDQFKHLETIYGVGTPTSIEFTPLVRNHIDVLIGEHLQNKLKPKVTCKDKETLNMINRAKQLAIYEAEVSKLRSQLSNNLTGFLQGLSEDQIRDEATEDKLKKLADDVERDYISDFEISGQYVLNNLVQNKRVALKDKLKIIFSDLLIAGQCYYRVIVNRLGETPELEVLDPFNTFLDFNPNAIFKKESGRAVYRRWMTKQQIISKYGRYMTESELKDLDGSINNYSQDDNVYYIRSNASGLISNVSVTAFDKGYYDDLDTHRNVMNLYPVYEVEWLSNNKIKTDDNKRDYRVDRYSGVRICQDIYVNLGVDENIVRSVENPLDCYLTINGVSYSDRGTEKPYSLVLATAHLQDRFDILHFYRDNLIATSGTKGSFLDVAQLPVFLGQTEEERLIKYNAYKKNGTALLNSAQEGATNLNTIYSGFDETVSGQSLQGIQLAIDATELTCSNITGVFRERLGGIEQRDAVTNVEVGIKQSATITKQYFRIMDSITNEILSDMLNACKISFKEGKVGSLLLGDKMQKIFTLDPTHFSFTDYDVHIDDTGDIAIDLENIKMISMELIKAQAVDIDILLEGMTSQSLTEMKENVSRSYKKRQEENDQLNQAMQQIEQLNQAIQQAQAENKQLAADRDALQNKADDIKTREIQMRYEVDKERNQIMKEFNKGKLEIDEERTELEKLQLLDNNPYNNTVKRQ